MQFAKLIAELLRKYTNFLQHLSELISCLELISSIGYIMSIVRI